MSSSIDKLKARIRSIERAGSMTRAPAPAIYGRSAAWTPGLSDEQDSIASTALDSGAVHEIKPSCLGPDWPAAWAAARSFALALAGRRLRAADHGPTGSRPHSRMLLWCTSANMAAEFGTPYGPGLYAFGLDPSCLVMAEPARSRDVLWATEQALKSGALALVVSQFDEVALTPARRLALAASQSNTPCLLLTHPRSPPAAATATRWRIAPAASARHPFDPQAPGNPRFAVILERCRSRPLSAQASSFTLEWCDAAFCFRLASDVADRTTTPSRSIRRAAASST